MSAMNDGQQQPVFVSSVTRIFADGKSNAETKNNTSQRSSLEDNSFLPRLVSEHPLDSNASIETVIEPVSSSSTTTGSRRFRVVIRNGPDPVLSHIHASFLLPEKTQLPSLWRWKDTGGKPSLLAWTHFDNIGERNKGSTDESNLSTFLCVLVHPELLSIYNVYPRPNSGWTVQQEGWSVPLPAEFSSIFALPGGGLVLQRSPDEAELNTVFLEPPPHQQKVGTPVSVAFNLPADTMATDGNAPALFTLRHYQEDLTPLAHPTGFWTDALEQVLWVGESRLHGDDQKAKTTRTMLLVTHHCRLHRHAVWSLHHAPPPPKPPTLPMYYAARHNYQPPNSNIDLNSSFSNNHFKGNSLPHALLWEHDDDDDIMELDTQTPFSRQVAPRGSLGYGASSGKPVSRQEALAEALGVAPRRTPQNIGVTSGATGVASSHRTSTSFFSPTPKNESMLDSTANQVTATKQNDRKDVVMEDANLMPPPANMGFFASTNPNTNFFSTIHSHFLAKCIFQQPLKSCTLGAEKVFLLSDSMGVGLTVLAILSTSDDESFKRLELLEGTIGANEEFVKMRLLTPEGLVCLDAEPVKATPLLLPIKKCSGRIAKEKFATDLLVLQFDRQLMLYRSNLRLCPLQLTPRDGLPNMKAAAVMDSIDNRVSLRDENQEEVRVTVELILPESCAEQSLCAIQSTLHKSFEMSQIGLQFRIDCIRVFQNLVLEYPSKPQLSFKALSAVVHALVQRDLGMPSHKRISADPFAPSGAWETLQSSEYGLDYDIFVAPKGSSSLRSDFSWLASLYARTGQHLLQISDGKRLTPIVFDSLHMLFEDSKLSNLSFPPNLKDLLTFICEAAPPSDIRNRFLQYYEADVGFLGDMMDLQLAPVEKSFSSFPSPPDILRWVDDMFASNRSKECFSSQDVSDINPACRNILFLKQVLPLLSGGQSEVPRFVNCLVAEGFETQLAISETFIPGIAFPILSLLYKLTNEASQKALEGSGALSAEGLSLIGRNDLSLNLEDDFDPSNASIPPIPIDHSVSSGDNDNEESPADPFGDQDRDGLVPLEVSSSMIFKDNRIHEAARLVRSSRPMFLRVPRVVEISDHEFEQLKQRKLSLLARRCLALPLSRGMLTIGSLTPLAAESLPIPQIILKGRVPPTNNTLTLDQSEIPPESRVWPDFHNGVAAGLRLPEKDSPVGRRAPISRTWILYNRPPKAEGPGEDGSNNAISNSINTSKNHAHGGFLLALGIRGHLSALRMTDIYEYLTQGTISTTVGVLLGMAADKKGSCDMSISKMLCLHIPSLIPQHFSAIDVASAVQAAAVTGVGLLYQRSSHRMMTEFLLNEIGKRPESDTSAFDREAYTLSCGLALGMVNLCIGEKLGPVDRAAGITDLRVEERLRRYINGGQANEEEARRTRESNDRFSIPLPSNGADNEKCSIIFETEMINTDVTAPAATLALGLMYMKSGNRTVASAVSIPQTHFLLEFVRPDFLGLRIVARSLILWDDVQPSQEWIESQVPSVVQSAYHSMRNVAKRVMEGRTPVKTRAVDYDRRAIRQIYVNILAGAAFSVGLRFAGTGDERAKKALFDSVLQLYKLREGNDAVSVVSKPEFPILETCLGLAALSLSMVMAGTGDLDCLRLFKTLRWRHDKDITYGTHMVFASCTGLLFLGGGTMTLGRSPEDIAALITAFFPRFPIESTDNQYHLQALRHLYALAAKKADICAIDVDTGERVFVPVDVLMENGTPTRKMQVPCLLLNTDIPIRYIRVVSDDFYPMTVPVDSGVHHFFVKRRSAPENLLVGWNGDHASRLLSQLDFLALHPVDKPFFAKLVEGKQAKDRYGIILVFLSILVSFRGIDKDAVDPLRLMWDLRLIRTFTENDVVNDVAGAKYLPLEKRLLGYLLEKAFQKVGKLPADSLATERLKAILHKA